MYHCLIDNNLISLNQAGSKQGVSCINQLFLITHETYDSFDEGFEFYGVFLGILKAFDKL